MATTPDTILAQLKELQSVIPGIESSIARLQSLLKAGFGGSGGSLAASELQLQNMAKAAETAIAAMSDVSKAEAAQRSLQAAIAETRKQLELLRTAGTTAQAAPVMTARQQHDQEYQALKQEMMAGPQAAAAQVAQWEAKAAEIEAANAKIRQSEADKAKAATDAAQAQITAMDRVILKQREVYGVGESGRYFTQSELQSSLKQTAGGARGFKRVFGTDVENYVDQMKAEGQIAQSLQNKYQYKFTERTPEMVRASQQLSADAETLRKRYEALGMSAEEAAKQVDMLYHPRGQRLPAAAPATTPKLSQEQELQQTLKEGGLYNFFGNPQRFDQFQQRLSKLGISLMDIKRATTDVASGITTLSFEGVDKSTGIMRNATLYVDEFGRVVTQGTSKVKTFEDIITQNITKVLTWALALGVVYGSLQKIGELVESMKKIQDALTDVSITTKSTAQNLNLVYESVLKISQATSTDLAGGLTALNQALRATGGAADDTTRVSTGLKLLTDSLTLAKLAGIETKRAMDLLIAGLKQLDQPLDSGGQLLDKFQAISNQANSSMEDMATTFAITAGAAQDVGVGVNDLVAIIGAFSEATSLSATETGNALRAMFSNFTQPQAVQTLNKYGIAVQDINGEFKSFIDIFQQASNLARSGVLSERQVAEIANAIGGGSRRQAQVTALLTVAPRQQGLKEFLDEGKAAGASQDALAKKTETMSSAVERLQNSFDNLAKSLGNEGGFIDFLTTGIDLLTKMVDLVSQLVKSLGPGLPLLLAGGLGLALLKSQGPSLGKNLGMLGGAIGSPFGNLGGIGVGGGSALGRLDAYMGGGEAAAATKTDWGAIGTQFGKNAASAFLPIIPLLIGQVAESTKSGDWTGTVGMGVGAAFMGVISGNPIWALVGGLIGKAVFEGVKNAQELASRSTDIQQRGFSALPDTRNPDEIKKYIDQLAADVSAVAGKNETVQRTISSINERASGATADATLQVVSGKVREFMAQGMGLSEAFQRTSQLGKYGGTTAAPIVGTSGFTELQVSRFIEGEDLLQKAVVEFQKAVSEFGNLPEQFATSLTSNAFLAVKEAFVGTQSGIKSATATGELIGTPEYEYNRKKRYEFTQDLAKGDLSPADYKNRMEALGSSGLTSSVVVSAMNPQINKSNVDAYKDSWLKVKDALTIADEGTRTYISNVAASLTGLNEEYIKLREQQELYKRGLSSLDSKGYDELVKRLEDIGVQSEIARNQIDALLKSIEDTNNASKFSFKGFADYSKYSADQMRQLIEQARGLQDIYARQTNTPLDQLVKTAPDIVTMTKDGFDTWHGVYQQFLDSVLSDVDEFKNRMEEKMKFNFKSLRNVPAEMAQRLQQAMNYYTNLLKQYGFNEKNEAITVLFKDNQVGQLVGSQTALQLALEDLTEVEKKKLDGVYNLPSGATAYIPLQAGQLLSEYTNNTMGASNVNYGATSSAPPVPGTYPLGTPPSAMSTEELIKRFLAQMTPLQQQAKQVGAEKYADWKGVPYKMPTQWDQPWYEKYGMPMQPTGATPQMKAAEQDITAKGAGAEAITNVFKQLYGTFAPVAKALSVLTTGSQGIFGLFGDNKKTSAATPPVNVTITPEKIQNETTVHMTIALDSRRLWEGLRRVAHDDYVRMTASVGESQRSRGNVV